jgi:hypothetical protein
LCIVGSGGGTTGGIGFIRGSLSTPTTNDRRSIARTKIAKDALLLFGEQAGVRSCVVTNAGADMRTQDMPSRPLLP